MSGIVNAHGHRLQHLHQGGRDEHSCIDCPLVVDDPDEAADVGCEPLLVTDGGRQQTGVRRYRGPRPWSGTFLWKVGLTFMVYAAVLSAEPVSQEATEMLELGLFFALAGLFGPFLFELVTTVVILVQEREDHV